MAQSRPWQFFFVVVVVVIVVVLGFFFGGGLLLLLFSGDILLSTSFLFSFFLMTFESHENMSVNAAILCLAVSVYDVMIRPASVGEMYAMIGHKPIFFSS